MLVLPSMSIGLMRSYSSPWFSLRYADCLCLRKRSDAVIILNTNHFLPIVLSLFACAVDFVYAQVCLCVAAALPQVDPVGHCPEKLRNMASAVCRTFLCNNLCACFPAVSISPPALALFSMFRAATLPQIDLVGHCPETR